MLKHSTDSAAGRIVKNVIIPAISLLQQQFPLSPDAFLQESQSDTPGKTSALCDLERLDLFLDSLKTK